jgi:hypothetical protein
MQVSMKHLVTAFKFFNISVIPHFALSWSNFYLDKEFKKKLASKGVLVESIQGGEPIDGMFLFLSLPF